MSIQVHTLKDKDGNRIYPLTHVSAVVDDEGKTITEIVENTYTKEEVDEKIAQAIVQTLNTEV